MVTAILLAISFSVTLTDAYVIEGSLTPPVDAPMDWHAHTRIHVDGSQYVGFVRSDGTFQVSGVPSGSYLIEPIHPSFIFQTARVDINSKGRIRARRVNAPQPNAVDELPYPLKLLTHGKAVYFKPREQLRTIDLLFNPNVLYVLVPFLLVMVLTKMVNTNDPELQKELQQMNLQQQLPDMSELLSSVSLFGDRKKPSGSGKRRVTDDGNRATGTSNEAGFGSATHHGSSGRKEKKRRAQ